MRLSWACSTDFLVVFELMIIRRGLSVTLKNLSHDHVHRTNSRSRFTALRIKLSDLNVNVFDFTFKARKTVSVKYAALVVSNTSDSHVLSIFSTRQTPADTAS
jgi:hypothetical protein